MTAQYDNKSKYIKPKREKRVFHNVSILYFLTLFIMPQYFGIPVPFFDLTVLRIMMIVILIMIFADKDRSREFLLLIKNNNLTKALIPYVLVLIYTMILRTDINALLNPLLEIINMFILLYIIRDTLGTEKTLKLIIICGYIMTILGIIEYVMGRSPFSYLETIKGIYTGAFIRSGHYRIMSSAVHSLGYGLILVVMAPIACIDFSTASIDLLKRPVLVILTFINVFLTGSRSTLSVFILEILFIFIVTDRVNKKRFLFAFAIFLVAFLIFFMLTFNTSMGQYIMLQITSIIDSAFGTKYSIKYGADSAALGGSSNYRDQLKEIFHISWLNPLLGIGRSRAFSSEINGSYIYSIDSFYIAEYVRYAYPGMIFYIMFLMYNEIGMIRNVIRTHSAVVKALMVGSLCYILNIYWVDSLQTLKYLYIIYALFEYIRAESAGKGISADGSGAVINAIDKDAIDKDAIEAADKEKKDLETNTAKHTSRYIKRKVF